VKSKGNENVKGTLHASVKCSRQLRMNSPFFVPWCNRPRRPRPPHCRGFMIVLRHTTPGRTPLDEWSARRRDLYLTTHNTHKRQTSMSAAGFKPTIPASEWPQTHALDRTATGIVNSPF